MNRDATRNWKQPDAPDQHNPQLHITLFRCAAELHQLRCRLHACSGASSVATLWQLSPHCCAMRANRHPCLSWLPPCAHSKCEVDRSTLALFYSPNLVSWVLAGMVDYHVSLGRHFAYPHMLIDGARGQYSQAGCNASSVSRIGTSHAGRGSYAVP